MTGPAALPDQPQDQDPPLPEPRPHLGHALASEWTKMVSVRSTLWTLGALVLLVVGIGLLAVGETEDPAGYVNPPHTAAAVFGLLVGQIAVIVLGVLTVTSEYATGLIRTTLTAAPDRARVLTAKYLVFSAVAFTVVSASVAVVGIASMIAVDSPDAHQTAGEWLAALAGCLYITLLGVLGLAIGAVVRHSAGAIAVMLGLVMLPPVVGGMLTMWESLTPLGNLILRYNAPVAIMQMFGLPTSEVGGLPGNWAQLVLIVAVAGAAVAGSYAVVGRRDV
ncbi:ABC transporter permease subunit [Streptomyces sp. 2P-4]|uniref:ABC transporter permease subunit n=1 Tax=Streptomyces sp. 2P-4 TaxID=2931974 RepID=UPI0025423E35|nr:ABC transporter permease subunit [Streptomyces sp. 2P-4]